MSEIKTNDDNSFMWEVRKAHLVFQDLVLTSGLFVSTFQVHVCQVHVFFTWTISFKNDRAGVITVSNISIYRYQ